VPQRTLGKPAVDGEANELPVVALPKRGRIVRSSESLEALMKRQRGRRPIDCDMGGDLGVAAGFTWYCEAARCVDDSCSVRGLGQPTSHQAGVSENVIDAGFGSLGKPARPCEVFKVARPVFRPSTRLTSSLKRYGRRLMRGILDKAEVAYLSGGAADIDAKI